MKAIKTSWFKIPSVARRVIGLTLLVGFGTTLSYIAGTFFIKMLCSLVILAERLMDMLFKAIIF